MSQDTHPGRLLAIPTLRIQLLRRHSHQRPQRPHARRTWLRCPWQPLCSLGRGKVCLAGVKRQALDGVWSAAAVSWGTAAVLLPAGICVAPQSPGAGALRPIPRSSALLASACCSTLALLPCRLLLLSGGGCPIRLCILPAHTLQHAAGVAAGRPSCWCSANRAAMDRLRANGLCNGCLHCNGCGTMALLVVCGQPASKPASQQASKPASQQSKQQASKQSGRKSLWSWRWTDAVCRAHAPCAPRTPQSAPCRGGARAALVLQGTTCARHPRIPTGTMAPAGQMRIWRAVGSVQVGLIVLITA